MWHALETALDVLELLAHRRFYASFLGSLALAYLIHRFFPDPDLGSILAIAVGVAGFIVGLVWEWRS